MSSACLFGRVLLSAHGATTQPPELVVLSPTAFERWPAVEPFRRFDFGVFADRLADLKALVEAVAFQALAGELGTARERVTVLDAGPR